MFRSAGRLPTRQNSSLRSSDKPLGAAVFRLNGTLRNITIFSDVSANTYTASGEEGKRQGNQAPVEDAFIRFSAQCLTFINRSVIILTMGFKGRTLPSRAPETY